MNAITHEGVAHPFSTVAELLALASKLTRTVITHLYRGGLTLVGYDARPVMHIIGTLAEPVIVPTKLRARKGIKP